MERVWPIRRGDSLGLFAATGSRISMAEITPNRSTRRDPPLDGCGQDLDRLLRPSLAQPDPAETLTLARVFCHLFAMADSLIVSAGRKKQVGQDPVNLG